MTAAIVRQNRSAEVLPFEDAVVPMDLSWRDSIVTNAERLASIGGGGTCVSAPLAQLNARKAKGDLVVVVSDNESWIDATVARGTATMQEWSAFRSRNPNARLVLIDLQPYGTTQATGRDDILNVGGFSDHVFEVVSEFTAGRLRGDHWVRAIESVVI
jgi:60 kDa SS-A/Ro ribonucleoprotein